MPKLRTYIPKSKRRIQETFDKRKFLQPRSGRTIPRLDQLKLGEGRDFRVVICQLDIASSTIIANQLEDPHRWAMLLNIFLTEATYVLRDYSGELDKYTGDGLLAIFGVGVSGEIAVKNAIEFCLTMFTIIGNCINSFLASKSLPHIGIKAGIDYGNVFIERLGIKGTNDLLIVGETANIAAKLEDAAKTGKLIIGDDVYKQLPVSEQEKYCKEIKVENLGFNYKTYLYSGRWASN